MIPHPGLTLLPSETTWELCLRKAGLNPYAAQCVLGMLRKPAEEGGEKEEGKEGKAVDEASHHRQPDRSRDLPAWGLGAFVQMSKTERIAMFAQALGRSAVERVSGLLDRAWGNGAAYGNGDYDDDVVMVPQGWRRPCQGIDREPAAFDAGGGSGGDVATSSADAMLVE